MQKWGWMAGALLTVACLTTPGAHAQNQPPPAPGTAGAPGIGAGAAGAPGTTHAGATAPPAKPVPLPGVRTVMVFPFENNTASGGRALGEALADAVQRGMDASRVYATAKFNPDSLLVQRAAAEQSGVLTDALKNVIDPIKGTVDQARAMQIAQRTGMQALMLGSIEEYTYDKAANKVSLVATAQILDAFTGEPLRTAGVTGTATGAAGADESTVAQAAATDVAGRILNGLSVPPPPPPPPHKKGHKHQLTQEEEGSRHRSPGWLPSGILLAILALAVS
jgi:hypothetical protein